MNIHESAEDYLEAILILRERQGAVRSIDIVHQLELTKPSVSVAMKRFRENGYIEMDSDGFITLLPPGGGDCPAHLQPPQAADPISDPAGGQRGRGRRRCLQDGARFERRNL